MNNYVAFRAVSTRSTVLLDAKSLVRRILRTNNKKLPDMSALPEIVVNSDYSLVTHDMPWPVCTSEHNAIPFIHIHLISLEIDYDSTVTGLERLETSATIAHKCLGPRSAH